MSRDGELRRHARAEKSSPVQIVWKDSAGVDKYVNGKTLDISASGMRVEVSDPIERRTYVTLQCAALALQGYTFDDAEIAEIVMQFSRLETIARTVFEWPLPFASEPAPVFRP